MAGAPITHFEPDEERLDVIYECMENYDVGDPDAEWPNNVISRRTVVYGSGVIVRDSDIVRHAVDPEELARCQRLSKEVAAVMDGVSVGMGSNRHSTFRGFFIASNVDEPAPTSITGDLIRAKFGGTIFPLYKITVEPLVDRGTWWSEVKRDVSGVEKELVPWRAMIAWFSRQSDFKDSRFIRIGGNHRERSALYKLEDKYPEGTVIPGCVFPRLALGLTHTGSLIGIFGHSALT